MTKSLRILILTLLPAILFFAAGNNFVSAEEVKQEVHFRICKSNIDNDWMDNIKNIKSLQEHLSNNTPSSIYVKAAASPDGPLALNSRLALERAEATVSLLKRLCPSLPDSVFVVSTISEDIDGAISYIKDSGMDWAQEAVTILSKGVSDPEEGLRHYKGGKVWRYLADNVFPLLRRAEITLVYSKNIAASPASGEIAGGQGPEEQVNTTVPVAPVSSIEGKTGESGSDNSVPAWAIVVMSVLGVSAAAFGTLFARERIKNKGNSGVKPVEPAKPVSPHVSGPSPAVSPEIPAVDPSAVATAATVAAVATAAAAAADSPEEEQKNPSFLEKVKGVIADNIADSTFGVEELAAKVGMSRIHLNRKLKAEAETSPSALLKDARMGLAADLLREGKMSIADISAQSGFSTPSYFATAFKDYYKMSPSEFVSAK